MISQSFFIRNFHHPQRFVSGAVYRVPWKPLGVLVCAVLTTDYGTILGVEDEGGAVSWLLGQQRHMDSAVLSCDPWQRVTAALILLLYYRLN